MAKINILGQFKTAFQKAMQRYTFNLILYNHCEDKSIKIILDLLSLI